MYVLGSVEGQLKVVFSVDWVKLTVVERLRSEMVNQSTESHTITPTRRKVGYIHVLTNTQTYSSSSSSSSSSSCSSSFFIENVSNAQTHTIIYKTSERNKKFD